MALQTSDRLIDNIVQQWSRLEVYLWVSTQSEMMWIYCIEAKSQDISLEVKTWMQMATPNGQ